MPTARFIGNDWDAARTGEDYVSRLGGAASPLVRSLDDIGREHAALVEATAVRKGWT